MRHLTIKKALKLSLLSLFLVFGWISGAFATDYASPEKAFSAFVKAVQEKNLEAVFDLDYSQAGKTEGRFKHEVAEIKSAYSKCFDENPSICPDTYGAVPCDKCRTRNIVHNVRLLIPKGAEYKILEAVSDDSRKTARLLIKVSYTPANGPIWIDDLKIPQVYSGGITPIPPCVATKWGILTKENVFFSVKEVGSGYKWPVKYTRKDIKELTLEATCRKIGSSWLVYSLKCNNDTVKFF